MEECYNLDDSTSECFKNCPCEENCPDGCPCLDTCLVRDQTYLILNGNKPNNPAIVFTWEMDSEEPDVKSIPSSRKRF